MNFMKILLATRSHVAFLVGLGSAVGLVNAVWHYIPDAAAAPMEQRSSATPGPGLPEAPEQESPWSSLAQPLRAATPLATRASSRRHWAGPASPEVPARTHSGGWPPRR